MRFLVRVLLVFFVISAVLSIIRGFLGGVQSPRERVGDDPPRPRPVATPAATNRLVKDPVCGTYVPEQTAIQADGKYFCSNECRSKYLAG